MLLIFLLIFMYQFLFLDMHQQIEPLCRYLPCSRILFILFLPKLYCTLYSNVSFSYFQPSVRVRFRKPFPTYEKCQVNHFIIDCYQTVTRVVSSVFCLIFQEFANSVQPPPFEISAIKGKLNDFTHLIFYSKVKDNRQITDIYCTSSLLILTFNSDNNNDF